MQSVYVAGIGMTKFGKDRRSLAEICHDAAQTALTSSEIQEVDAIYIGVMNPEEFTGDSNIASHIASGESFTSSDLELSTTIIAPIMAITTPNKSCVRNLSFNIIGANITLDIRATVPNGATTDAGANP